MYFKKNPLSAAVSAAVLSFSVAPAISNATLNLGPVQNYTNTGTTAGSRWGALLSAGVYAGTLTNTGEILSFGQTTGAFQNGAGIGIDDTAVTGLSGSILVDGGLVQAYVTDYTFINATGIYVGGDIQSTGLVSVTNGGSVEGQAWGAFSANGRGLAANNIAGTVSVSSAEIRGSALGSQASGYGITTTGSLTASGSISVVGDGEDGSVGGYALGSDALAAGIYLGNNADGSITVGSGAEVFGYAEGVSTAVAGGIVIGDLTDQGDLNGSISVDGGVIGNADNFPFSESGYSGAVGIYVADNVSSTGSIMVGEDGEVVADASRFSRESFSASSHVAIATAAAIRVGGDFAGSLSNDGVIAAYAYAYSSDVSLVDAEGAYAAASATGVYVGGVVSGQISSNGRIWASATAEADATLATSTYAEALARGISVGSIDSTGSITLTNNDVGLFPDVSGVRAFASGEDYAAAVGIEVVGDMDGAITTDGLIFALAEADSGVASAQGIAVGEDLNGTLTNNGVVVAVAETGSVFLSGDDAYATGVYIDGDIAGSITNRGEILAYAYATNGDGDAYAAGILGGNITATGSIVNGAADVVYGEDDVPEIRAAAYSDTDSATAFGIDVGDVRGSIQNYGLISAQAYASSNSSAEAWGIRTDDLLGSGSILNNGIIEASAFANSYSAYAIGIQTGYIGEDASITNNGSVIATASVGEDGNTASATGLLVEDINGTITNNGLISASADAASGYYAYAYGIDGGYIAATGSITNGEDGVISAYAVATTDSAYAYGISVGTVAGSIANYGSISAEAVGDTESDANAWGIDAGNLVGSGSILNEGTISASAFNNTYEAYAYGIETGDIGEDASITNNGSIIATAISGTESGDTASATGLYVDEIAGTITNNGLISASASAPYEYYAYAYGIRGGNITATGSITNGEDGVISAYAYATTSSASAYGISVGTVAGSIANYGSISAEAVVETDSEASAWGIRTGDLVGTGSILNEGTISASAFNSTYSAYAYGIETGDIGEDASITNNGSIIATAISGTESGDTASATGLYVGEIAGTITNNGLISASASAPYEYYAYAYGIRGGNITATGSITNGEDGVISAYAYATTSSASAYGIYVGGEDMAGLISNQGTIDVTATVNTDSSAEAYGIYTGNLVGNASIQNDGTITVDAENGTYSAYAWGIYSGDVGEDAEITSNGSIFVSATTGEDGDTASATGIRANEVSGSISNGGLIQVTASATEDDAYAAGINTWNVTSTGSITNTVGGVINVNAYNDLYDASAWGIAVGNVAGEVANYGSINVFASQASSDSEASAWGITALDVSGTITNGGSIDVSADNPVEGAEAYGIAVDDIGVESLTWTSETTEGAVDSYMVSGIISGGSVVNTNTGSITATATGWTYATAGGIEASDVYGSIINAGSITANSYGEDDVNAFGIRASSVGEIAIEGSGAPLVAITASGSVTYTTTGGGSLENSGSISAFASASVSTAIAEGVGVEEVSGGVVNSGSISASASAGSNAVATGVAVGSVEGSEIEYSAWIVGSTSSLGWISLSELTRDSKQGGSVSNTSTGSITASATGSEYGYAFGVYAEQVNGLVSNAGDIHASADGGFVAYASGIEAGIVGIGTEYSAFSPAGAVPVILSGASIENTGSIGAAATGSNAYAFGVRVNDLAGSVLNDGSIDASAAGEDALARGILTSFIEPTGSVTVGSDGTVHASVVQSVINDLPYTPGAVGVGAVYVAAGGSINNSGMISASASGDWAAGLVVDFLDGTVNNDGVITASGDREAFAIWTGSEGAGDINNLAGGRVVGDFEINASGVTFTNAGRLELGTESGFMGAQYVQTGTGVIAIVANSIDEYGSVVFANEFNDFVANSKIEVDVAESADLTSGDVLEDVLFFDNVDYDPSGNSYAVSDNSYLISFTAVKDGQTVDLNAQADTANNNTVLAAVNTTPSSTSRGVARGFDYLIQNPGSSNSDDMDDVLHWFGRQGSQGTVAQAAIDNTGLISGASGLVVRDAMGETGRAVRSRVRSQSGLASGEGISSDRYFWLKAFGSQGEQDARDGAAGYDIDSVGFVLGADGTTSDDNRFGVAVAYSSSEVDTNDGPRQSADIDGWQIMGYGAHALSDTSHIRFAADMGFNEVDGKRAIPTFDVRADAEYDVDTYHVGAGWDNLIQVNDKVDFLASVGVDYTRVESDSYTESGAGPLNQRVDDESTEALVFSIDGELTYRLENDWSLIGRAGIGYDTINDEATMTSAFVGGGTTFVTTGIESDPVIGRLGFGISKQASDDVSISVNYDAELREDYDNQTTSVKVRWRF